MNVVVRTGTTRSTGGSALLSDSLESAHGEQALILLELITGDTGAPAIERECVAIVRHALLEAEGEAAERLDGTLKEMNGLLKGMLLSGAIKDVHMLLAILDTSETLHVSHAGRAEAYLIRKNSTSQITEYSTGKPIPAFVHIASGKLDEGDVVIFSTQRLLRTLTPAQLARHSTDPDNTLPSIARSMEGEREEAALATLHLAMRPMSKAALEQEPLPSRLRGNLRTGAPGRRGAGRDTASSLPAIAGTILTTASAFLEKLPTFIANARARTSSSQESSSRTHRAPRINLSAATNLWASVQNGFRNLLADLADPKRKKRAHLLLLAGAIAVLIVLWASVHLFTSSQRSKTRSELEKLVEQISTEIQTAENRHIIGDKDAANAILDRAETNAKQVMDNESGLFRSEANELLGRIRSKREEINNIARLTPRVAANLAANTPDVLSQGLITVGEGEFLAFDRQDVYRILLNSVEQARRISEDLLIVDGAGFPRFQTNVFLMTGNSVMEWIGGQSVSMKTDDPKGWVSGTAIATYLRFLYVLSPDTKQIYKYERVGSRYSIPVGYNVNGDLTGAIDIAIDGNVYVLKEGGTILKLFRGEAQPFVIRQAPEGILKDTTKLFKVTDRNFYVLDPKRARIIVLTDGGATGESSYLRQFILEGEQVGELKDLYVTPDEGQLYVLSEKQLYVIDLTSSR